MKESRYKKNMSVPFEIKKVDGELNKKLLADFSGEKKYFVVAGQSKCLMPSNYETLGPEIYNMKLRAEDVWICTFPRSGTTFTQEMIWLIANNLNIEVTQKVNLVQRFPHLEMSTLMNDELKSEAMSKVQGKGDPEAEQSVARMGMSIVPLLGMIPGARFIKSHLPFSLLPPTLLDTSKVVYVARHPKDVAVSYYHLSRLLRIIGYSGEFDKFWDYFEKDQLIWSPYWNNLKEAWELRDHPNMLFLIYDDIVKDMKATIRKISAHLGKNLTEEQVDKLADHMHIDNFRKNPTANLEMIKIPDMQVKGEQGFIRKGKSGGWKDYFTPELNARADKWITENMAKIPGFSFPNTK